MVLRKVPKTGISSLMHKSKDSGTKICTIGNLSPTTKFDRNDKVCHAARKKSMKTLNRIGLFSRPSLFNLYTNETNVNKRIWVQK